MATVKISDLPVITQINLDTTQTILPIVDISTDETAQITVRTLADGLFHNDALKVGANEILFSNTIAQFSGNGTPFLQVNLQNFDGDSSGDYVVTADIGTNANNFIDVGINGSTFSDPTYSAMQALDGYLYVQGSLSNSTNGNLIIGTASSGANVVIAPGGTTTQNVVAHFTKNGLVFQNSAQLEFADGSIQTVAAASAALTQLAANTANSASSNTIIIQGVNLTQNTNITEVNQYAQSAFATANDTNGYATSAYATANGANGLAAGAFNTANGANGLAAGAFNKANNAVANTFAITVNNSIYIPGTLVVDGLIYANGATYVANAMSIPTTYTSPQTAITLNYQQANIVKTNVTADLVVSHTGIVLGKYIDLFVYNDSADVRTITHGVPANNSTTKASTVKVSPYSTKHLKYFTVDSDLANTYVIESVSENLIESDLTITGNVLTQGTISLNNSSFASNTAFVKITASDDFATVAPSNTNYMLQITGKANTVTRFVLDSFGANTYPLVSGRMGRGSAASPAATSNNDVMMRIVGNGYTGTQFPSSSPTKIDFVAAENFSNTNRGTRIEFWNTPTGSNNIQRIATFNANEAQFTGAVNPQKGFIYNSRLPAGDQTAITIDFANDALIKANLINDLTVSFTNFQFGKIVDLWLINNATGFGAARTITHGCSATNSTTNSTTFDMAGTSCAHLRYFSVNGDLANTFVSINFS
jgi:hypothetical protein